MRPRFLVLKFVLVLAMLCAAQLSLRPVLATTYAVENGVIKLTAATYEIGFREADGGIAYILDKNTNQNVSDGSVSNDLWWAGLSGNISANASAYSDFKYAWDAATSQLTFTYTSTDSLNVTVTVDASSEQSLKLQASVTNQASKSISSFRFPNQLKVIDTDITDALLPLIPGAQINSTFFKEGRTYIDIYPGVMFADYVAINSSRGQLAVYGTRGDVLQPVLLGFQHDNALAGYTLLSHNFRTWIDSGKSWLSPWVTITVGKSYPDTIASYRTDNSIDKYPSLAEKLGDKAATYFAAPMYKLDLQVIKQTFNDLQQNVLSKLNFPGIVHLVAIQTGGHDNNYPDIMPPNPKWGTADDFAAFDKAVHAGGGLVIPYINMSWWDDKGPTLVKLPAGMKLFDLIVLKDSTKLPDFEKYGINGGYVMNLHHPFVQTKIAEQLTALKAVGVDGVFGDQWGARPAPYDFNPSGLDKYDPATSYFGGILDLYNTSASQWMTESGVDVLADKGTGFMGTNYLWDMLGYRGATAGVTTYYPMAGMLLRDKVLLYQHDLAAETWTKNKDMLRWNLTYGYGLSNAFFDSSTGGVNMNNPWLNLIGVYQKYVLANYADQLVTAHTDLGNGVRETDFGTYTVHSNWSDSAPYNLDGYTLPAGGVITQANDGSVTAGVFNGYNRVDLSAGDHYLVEVRATDAVKVFQPLGDDTPLTIKPASGQSTATVTAYHYDGTQIATVDATTTTDGAITFTYKSTLDGQSVGYYQIAP